MLHSSQVRTSLRVVALGLVGCIMLSCASAPPRPPVDVIRATNDRHVIERGRYLAYGPAHCASCHGDPARATELQQGAQIPLSGGRRFDLGLLGTVVAPNITADPTAGTGAMSDEALVRALRYGVSHSGRPLVPFMPFAELTDRDLQALISFLRSVPPVPRVAPRSELSWLGSFVVNVILKPQGPKALPPVEIEPERSADYGRYLAHTVANCHGCHTRRSKLTGAFTGPPFAGGMKLAEEGGTFITPDLTTDGVLSHLDERQFIERFRTRAQLPAPSPMPWTAFARMTDDDLGAIYRYLSTLPPSRAAHAAAAARRAANSP